MMFKEAILKIICLLLISYIAGCGGPKDTQPSITVWHWMTDRESAFQELAKRYEARTGIKVIFELYAPSDAYSRKVRAAAQGATLPDIFGILGEKTDFASFVKAGHVLDLTSYMEADNGRLKNRFFTNALAVNMFDADNSYGVKPGIYAVPLDVMTIQMVYNRRLLRELGQDPDKPPLTFEELLDIGKKISAAGAPVSRGKDASLQGFVCGWGELWMIDCFANNYAFNIMGKDKVLATIRGEVPYTDPDWIKVLDLFRQLKQAGVLASGIVTMVNKTAEQLFANEKAVFSFNGSWCVNVYKGMNPNLDYAVMPLPEASKKYPMSIWGGAGSSFMVNANAKNKEDAVKFLDWLTDNQQQEYLAEKTNNLPANKDCLKNISGPLAGFAKAMDLATHPFLWGISEFPVVIEALDKGIQSIIIGEKTAEQVAREVQKIKDRELSKRKQ
ncbi:MAG: extracellular solute-binding protein [Candidatus Omnitrophica bacterium]|nr:extracellular solute-binding protein [Candidatus Omnitrophota bacterium]